jgi:hypothetical protein
MEFYTIYKGYKIRVTYQVLLADQAKEFDHLTENPDYPMTFAELSEAIAFIDSGELGY